MMILLEATFMRLSVALGWVELTCISVALDLIPSAALISNKTMISK